MINDIYNDPEAIGEKLLFPPTLVISKPNKQRAQMSRLFQVPGTADGIRPGRSNYHWRDRQREAR